MKEVKSKHEEALLKVMESLKLAGWKVIRLDRRNIPDLIAISNKGIVAIEIESCLKNMYYCKAKYEGSPYYDQIFIVKPMKKRDLKSCVFFSQEEYNRAIELRKEGKSLTKIQEIMMREFNRKPAMGTLHKWFTGDIETSRIDRRKK